MKWEFCGNDLELSEGVRRMRKVGIKGEFFYETLSIEGISTFNCWGSQDNNCIAKKDGQYVLYDWPGEVVLGTFPTLKAAQVTAAILNERK